MILVIGFESIAFAPILVEKIIVGKLAWDKYIFYFKMELIYRVH
jgi:hypothetical protein